MTTEASASPRARRPVRVPEEDSVYEQIHTAILEHRLQPGMKLAEEKLASIFDVSRARVRSVLARLAHERIVEWLPKRGAYIARPSADKAHDVFEARSIIEPAIMRRLARTVDKAKIDALHQHVLLEIDARQREDKRSVIRLSGEFHNLAAKLAGNTELERTLQELSALTCLIILLYNSPTATSCRVDDHSAIVEAIECGDADRAAVLMAEHLEYIASNVHLEEQLEDPNLEDIFG